MKTTIYLTSYKHLHPRSVFVQTWDFGCCTVCKNTDIAGFSIIHLIRHGLICPVPMAAELSLLPTEYMVGAKCLRLG